MAADCTVIAADHPESAADVVISDAGFLAEPNVDDVAATLERALNGDRPKTDPKARANRFDWDRVAADAADAYRAAIDGTW